MTTTRRRTAAAWALGLLATALLSGCTGSSEASGDDHPTVTLQKVDGTDRYQVTLAAEAVTRLGIRTDAVRAVPAGTPVAPGVTTTVPYAAVVYDADGSTWAYTLAGTGSYVRAAIGVDSIAGGTAYLTTGPPAGTAVVVVGAPELLGAEYQIAGEE